MHKLPENASSSKKSTLTKDQLQRIEENRKKALERLQQRQIGSPAASIHTPAPKSVERGSYGHQTLSSNRAHNSIIAKRVEENRARALERLKSRQKCNDVSQVSPKDNSSCAQLSSGVSSNNSMSHISQNLNPSGTGSGGRTNLLTWSGQFSYQRQSRNNSKQQQNSNEPEKSKGLSLIAKINEGSIDQMQVVGSSSSREDPPSSQTTTGEFFLYAIMHLGKEACRSKGSGVGNPLHFFPKAVCNFLSWLQLVLSSSLASNSGRLSSLMITFFCYTPLKSPATYHCLGDILFEKKITGFECIIKIQLQKGMLQL